MSGTQDGQTGSLVAAAGLETDEAVLNNVDAADTVTAADGVGGEKEFDWVGDGLDIIATGSGRVCEFDGETLVEGDGEVFGLVGGVLVVSRQHHS